MTQTVRLQEAFKLALSLMLFYWLTLAMDWDLARFGALAIVVTSLSSSGASFHKGIMRVIGTGIGALAGFVLLSWFAQSPLGMLLAVAVYLIVIGYFLQTTQQADIWFNAGFLAVAVWSSSYMKVDTAFHFATNRFLETAAGVLLFTLVSVLLWPRTSGAALQQQGQMLWQDLQELYGRYRRQLINSALPADTADLHASLAGNYQQMLVTLEAAYFDTPRVREKKPVWERLRINLRTFSNTHELWRESIKDCHGLDLYALLPGLDVALDTLDKRLQYGTELWQLQSSLAADLSAQDELLQNDIVLDIDKKRSAKLTHFERAAAMNFVEQLHLLDGTSQDLLQTLKILAGLDSLSMRPEGKLSEDLYQPSAWNPERLLKAVFPALCWVTGYAFWIYVNPPGGPSVAMIAVAFGLMMLMAPTNLAALLLVLLVSMFVTVAPVYLFIMPLLDSGFAILSLVFIYAFIFAYLGGVSPVLKLGPLMMFVMMVDINNDQVYSFVLLVTAGLVMLLGVSVVVVVHRLLSPMRPEKIMLRSVQRFLGGCGRLVEELSVISPQQQRKERRLKKRIFESTLLPISTQLPLVEKNLDYSQFPDNTPEKVHGLVDSLQSIRFRLQALDATYDRVAHAYPELMQTLAPMNARWRKHVQAMFEQWARLQQTADVVPEEWNLQAGLSQALEQQSSVDDRALQNIYAVMGSTQSLLDAMQEFNDNFRQINWNQWAVARF